MNQSVKLNNISIDYTTIGAYAYLSVVPFCSIGLLANLMILYILTSDKYFAKATYCLIRMTVLCDFICNISSIIGYILMTRSKMNYDIGATFCRLLAFIIVSTYGVSMMNLCMISIDRYFAIVKPLSSFYRSYKKKLMRIGQLIAWIVVLAMSSPLIVIVDVYPDETSFCDLPQITTYISAYIYASSIILYCLPTVMLVAVYFRIMQHQRSYVQPGQISNFQIERNRFKRKKLMKMLIIITSTYTITTWPYLSTGFGIATTQKSLRQIRGINFIYYTFVLISFMATIAISVINPLIYFKYDHNIRNRFTTILVRWRMLCLNSKVTRMISSRTTNDIILPDITV
ncbi:Neuropeptide Y receptor type 2 [Trichoplax sp. H2]|nr:Neuropeptide Y receptor type 2 [Trichoplax sp. H2]|eukprot:RDD42320.1 Neuropeptide Y receptor type 2 [Trichoplax sp. H2]